jgi:hypothetical protein
MADNILAMDPGTHRTGWCLMSQKTAVIRKADFMASVEKNWKKNCQNMWIKFDQLLIDTHPNTIVFEIPEYWGGVIGQSARESGSVHKLFFLLGGYFRAALEGSRQIEWVTPSGWKGQMNKDMIRRRLKIRYPDQGDWLENLDHNAMDAIGIAYWFCKEKDKSK